MLKFDQISGVIFDMDGVLYRGHQPLNGASELIQFLDEAHIPFAMATNNSSQTPQSYMTKLSGMNIHGIQPEQVVTSGTVSVDFLRDHFEEGSAVYVIGGDGLMEMIEEAGFQIAEQDVDAVVVGIDRQLTYDKLHLATTLILEGATFIGTNPDVTFPTPEGVAPGAGSILALLETATDVKASVMGKPAQAMFQSALQKIGTRPQETLMIGDRLATDIFGGKQANLQTALMLTGVTHRDQVSESEYIPNAIYENLCELLKDWRESHRV